MRFSLLWLCFGKFAPDHKGGGTKLRRHNARKIIAPLHQTMILTLWACLWCWPCRGEAKMEHIAALPAPAGAMFADDQGNLIVALTGTGGLGMLHDGAIEIIATGPQGGAISPGRDKFSTATCKGPGRPEMSALLSAVRLGERVESCEPPTAASGSKGVASCWVPMARSIQCRRVPPRHRCPWW